MDTTELTAPHPHHHAPQRRRHPAFPVMLIITLLSLSACAAFAVIMTNGLDGRASAEVAPTPVLSGGAATELDGSAADTTLERLTFTVSNSRGEIVLGQPGYVDVVVRNPHDHPVRLEALSVRVLRPTQPGCLAQWLHVDAYPGPAGPVTVPAHDTARIPLGYELVDLPDVNQDACKGADFPLAIQGSGQPV